ncbi:hypothetical protein DMENIID0001_023670 [Sergentomyia squamirostris]
MTTFNFSNEFKNETPGNIEAAPQTEYPIFGALSPSPNSGGVVVEENRPEATANHVNAASAAPANISILNGSPTPQIVNVNEVQTNHIYSAPINHDFDNNNGPISPSDMENIENNNAEDYIANRNEIGVVVEPLCNAINRNILNSAPSLENAIVHESCVVLDIEEESCVPNTQYSCDSMLPVLSTKSQSFLENLDLRTEFSLPNDNDDDDDEYDEEENKMCDVKSTDSTTSGNSEIEEALMALESAIADEDTCDANDDDEMEAEDATMYEDVVKNLIGETMTMEVDSECRNHVDIEEIEAVARKLVDSVLVESEKIVLEMKEECKTQQDSVSLLEKSIDSLEEVFFTNIEGNKLMQSTPCVTNKITHIDPIANRRTLFFEDSCDEINEEKTFVKPTSDGTFVCESDAKKSDGTFVCDSEANGPTIVIDEEKDEEASVDLTTITPVNTPIDVNSVYSDSWFSQPSTSKAGNSGWFLHPQKDEEETAADATFKKSPNNATFEVLAGDEDDDEEDDKKNLDVTFEALRRQLEQVLPHAQGMQNPGNYTEDDDSAHEKEVFSDFAIEGPSNVQSAKEIIINYQRRPLSPIAEESEDETTFKTFITNEAKYQDNSTSTGYMETGEAIMGVSKTLMASNDTLFNFEDTLGDRDDQFSPLVEKKNLPMMLFHQQIQVVKRKPSIWN